jgi:hypothetical protein
MADLIAKSKKETRGRHFRGNAFGRFDAYIETPAADKEAAENFNTQEYLNKAMCERSGSDGAEK